MRYAVPKRCEPTDSESAPIDWKPWFWTRTIVELHVLLDGGDDLLGHHQERAVADHHVDLAVGRGELDPEAAGDLVAHARVAVLDVVALRVARAPQLVQVAGHRAGGADDDVARPGDAVDDADHLALGGARRVAERVRALDGRVPLGGEARGALAVGGVGAPALERGVERLQAVAGVGDERQPGVLEGVDGRDVEVDEADVGSAEGAARRGREVAPARADAEHDVGLAGERVGGGRAGGADRAERLRVVVGQRALAGLRLGDGDRRSPRRARAARRSPRRRSCRRRRRSAGGRARRSSVGGLGERARARRAGGARARRGGRTAPPASRRPRPGRPGAATASPRRSRPGR